VPVWYRETPLLIAVCAFSRSTEKPLRVYDAKSDGGVLSVGRAVGAAGKRGTPRACLPAPAPGLAEAASVASRLRIHESRPRVATARNASRFRPRGCVTCRASRTRREVEQCSRASRSRRSPLSRRAPARPRVTMSRGRATFWSAVTTTCDRALMLCRLWDECRGRKLMRASG